MLLRDTLNACLFNFCQDIQFSLYLKEDSHLFLIIAKRLSTNYEALPCPIVSGGSFRIQRPADYTTPLLASLELNYPNLVESYRGLINSC
jgi:hypothetical protein